MLNTCRLCGALIQTGSGRPGVRYAARHWAHHDCYLSAGKALDALHDWQIVAFSYRLIKEYGLEAIAAAAYEREKTQRDPRRRVPKPIAG